MNKRKIKKFFRSNEAKALTAITTCAAFFFIFLIAVSPVKAADANDGDWYQNFSTYDAGTISDETDADGDTAWATSNVGCSKVDSSNCYGTDQECLSYTQNTGYCQYMPDYSYPTSPFYNYGGGVSMQVRFNEVDTGKFSCFEFIDYHGGGAGNFAISFENGDIYYDQSATPCDPAPANDSTLDYVANTHYDLDIETQYADSKWQYRFRIDDGTWQDWRDTGSTTQDVYYMRIHQTGASMTSYVDEIYHKPIDDEITVPTTDAEYYLNSNFSVEGTCGDLGGEYTIMLRHIEDGAAFLGAVFDCDDFTFDEDISLYDLPTGDYEAQLFDDNGDEVDTETFSIQIPVQQTYSVRLISSPPVNDFGELMLNPLEPVLWFEVVYPADGSYEVNKCNYPACSESSDDYSYSVHNSFLDSNENLKKEAIFFPADSDYTTMLFIIEDSSNNNLGEIFYRLDFDEDYALPPVPSLYSDMFSYGSYNLNEDLKMPKITIKDFIQGPIEAMKGFATGFKDWIYNRIPFCFVAGFAEPIIEHSDDFDGWSTWGYATPNTDDSPTLTMYWPGDEDGIEGQMDIPSWLESSRQYVRPVLTYGIVIGNVAMYCNKAYHFFRTH